MLSRISWDSRTFRHRPAERGFKLSLPMTVEGPDPGGTFFRETTTLSFMSHQGALFPLANPVALGSRLKLAIALPPKLGEGQNLTLVVKGTIVDIDGGDGNATPPQVALRLESRYIIQPDAA
ncbi:MAG TPA: hypothetical protein P5119_08360 [Candidatus Aminicenantes bacterium]|nr:hypothetical protein [Candidatus Aminicenantes bacterium]HRY65339.1 hypothetical protein [Candidatus Aminicenantes bacterium]HRZ72193.1 hypothetical protein [Candidatus Aminicenantes bacterium]